MKKKTVEPVKKIKCSLCREIILKVYPYAPRYEDYGKAKVVCTKCQAKEGYPSDPISINKIYRRLFAP